MESLCNIYLNETYRKRKTFKANLEMNFQVLLLFLVLKNYALQEEREKGNKISLFISPQ